MSIPAGTWRERWRRCRGRGRAGIALPPLPHAIAQDVYMDLGSGHDEKVYRRAMEVDLRTRGIEYDSERVLELRYKEHYVGENYADLVVGPDGEAPNALRPAAPPRAASS